MTHWPLLSLVTFLPLVGVGFIMTSRGEEAVVARNARNIALSTSVIVFALSIVLYGNRIGEFAAAHVGLGVQFQAVWNFVQWPIGLAFVWVAFVLLYRLAPDVHGLTWSQVTPGAIVAVASWAVRLRFRLRRLHTYGQQNCLAHQSVLSRAMT